LTGLGYWQGSFVLYSDKYIKGATITAVPELYLLTCKHRLKVGLLLLLSVSLHSAVKLCHPVTLILLVTWVLRSLGHWTLFVPMHCSVPQCSSVVLVAVVLVFFSNYGLTRCLPPDMFGRHVLLFSIFCSPALDRSYSFVYCQVQCTCTSCTSCIGANFTWKCGNVESSMQPDI